MVGVFLMSELGQIIGLLERFLSAQHKRRLLIVAFWSFVLSAGEVLVAAVVVPYVQCVGGRCPSVVDGIGSLGKMIPILSIGLLLLITLKIFVQGYFNWHSAGFHQQVQRDTISRLLDGYLYLDWRSFRSQHRAHYLRRCFTTAVDAAYVSQQCVTLLSSSLMLVFLLVLILWQDLPTAVGLIFCFMGLGLLTQRLIGRVQNRIAHGREAAMQSLNIGVAESLGAFREIRIYGLERFFLDRLDRWISDVAQADKRLGFLPTLPRMVIDFAIYAVLLAVISVWVALERPLVELLPQLVFYAVVARTLMPAMMNVLGTRAVLSGSIVNIQLALQEFAWTQSRRVGQIAVAPKPGEQVFFGLENVSFAQLGDAPLVLNQVTVRIQHPSWVALTGASGAGKSTLMELLCGIHVPHAGHVVHAWSGQVRPRIAYLPQQVFLLDGSVAHNVIFGFDSGDAARVDAALRLACLDEVVSQLVGGRDACVGVDGVRFSGGERQRLALARALYRSPDLLLLDEATSGIDEISESRLLSGLRQARPEMSVVFITHRTGNLRFADRVLQLDGGKLVDVPPACNSQ